MKKFIETKVEEYTKLIHPRDLGLATEVLETKLREALTECVTKAKEVIENHKDIQLANAEEPMDFET